jgi:NAD(P)-dependent dehydrogenase (short-subunit alcohol dehydrogenase family)
VWRQILLLALTFLSAGIAPSRAATVLITGANSGIGLEFAREYAAKGWTVIATHRRDTTPETLQDLQHQHPNVRIERMDVADSAQVADLAARLKGTAIDVLINNAAVFVLGGKDGQWRNAGADYAGQTLGTLDYRQFDTFMNINVAGTARVTEAFLPLIEAGKQKKIIALTSPNAQVTGQPLCCGLLWYSVSKAALDKLMLQISSALRPKGIIVTLLNPGAVRVEKQQGSDFPGMVELPEAVGAMIATIDRLTPADSGRIVGYDGSPRPW